MNRPGMLVLVLAIGVAPGTLPSQAASVDWTLEEAMQELDALFAASPRSPVQNRMDRVLTWLEKTDSSDLDLGDNGYARAFPLYMKIKRVEGRSASAMEACNLLADFIVEHDGLPPDAGKYATWIERLLTPVIEADLRGQRRDRVRSLVPVLAAHSRRGPYGAYAGIGSSLASSKAPEDLAVLVDIVGMAMADKAMDVEMKHNLLTFLYGGAGATPSANLRLPLITGSEPLPAGKERVPFVTFSGPLLETGDEISVTSFEGQVLLIDFWATWCGPCMREMPNVVAVYEQYKDRGFSVLGVSLDREGQSAKMREVMEKQGMDWPQVYDGKGWKTESIILNNIRHIPYTYLLDRSGVPRYMELRGAELERRVKELLAE